MKRRIDWKAVAPDGYAAQLGLATYARRSGLERALVDLSLAIVAISGWKRLAIAFRTPAGSCQPSAHGVPAGSTRAN